MNNSDYIKLLHKRSTGTISNEENEALNSWLSDNYDKKNLSTIWDNAGSYKKDFQPDVKKGLANVMSFIDEAETKKVKEPKVIQIKKRRFSPFAMAAALAVLIGVGAVITWYSTTAQNSSLVATTGIGETKELLLEDGTKVSLNENSYLSYAEGLTQSHRNVKLTGEAFFDVKPDTERPFVITTSRSTVTVLGTSFNVKAYKDQPFNEVTVKTGQVRFQPKNSSTYLNLTKDETAKFDFLKKEMKKVDNKGQNNISWHTQKLQFVDTPLAEALEAIEKSYDVQISDLPNQLSDCQLNANFDLQKQKITDVLPVIESILVITFSKTSEHVYSITGSGCK